MWIGWLEFDLLLGDVHSLKQKRSVIRPVVAELRRRVAVSAAETGSMDLHRRAGVGGSVVSADRAHVVDVLDAAERLVAARPEMELLSVRRGLRRSIDDRIRRASRQFRWSRRVGACAAAASAQSHPAPICGR